MHWGQTHFQWKTPSSLLFQICSEFFAKNESNKKINKKNSIFDPLVRGFCDPIKLSHKFFYKFGLRGICLNFKEVTFGLFLFHEYCSRNHLKFFNPNFLKIHIQKFLNLFIEIVHHGKSMKFLTFPQIIELINFLMLS